MIFNMTDDNTNADLSHPTHTGLQSAAEAKNPWWPGFVAIQNPKQSKSAATNFPSAKHSSKVIPSFLFHIPTIISRYPSFPHPDRFAQNPPSLPLSPSSISILKSPFLLNFLFQNTNSFSISFPSLPFHSISFKFPFALNVCLSLRRSSGAH
jgi:hypothetical protein